MFSSKLGVNLHECPEGVNTKVLPVVVGSSDKPYNGLGSFFNEAIVGVDGSYSAYALVGNCCVCVCVCVREGKSVCVCVRVCVRV